MKLHCATTNPGKLREFRLAVERLGAGHFEIEPLPGLGAITPCEEDGLTFEENAAKKAVYYSNHSPLPIFVDDSGLSVDALDGAPGVYSARYAGPDADDEENNRLLLCRMEGRSDRTARFVSVIALARAGEMIGTFRGTVEGFLTDRPRGENGFGYDPLFFHPPFGCTLAEVSAERKLSVSHRGKAIEKMLAFLRDNPAAV